MGSLLERLGVEVPVVQAGMGAGLAGHQLAGAVSAAGGLGTIGILAPGDLRREVAAGRRLTNRPLAVNLLLPFARRAHVEAASEADAVVTFWAGRSAGRQRSGFTSAALSRRRWRPARAEPTR
jgi:nitronate monooxygenase